jgi:hypothetical protein
MLKMCGEGAKIEQPESDVIVKRKAMLAWDVKQEAQFQTRFCCFICG